MTIHATEAVSYLRVSGQGQVDGDGFERQRASIRRRAKAEKFALVQEFLDEGVSGTKPISERPGLSDLLDRILGNGVRVVLVEKADRLARDLVEGELILREFRLLGVRVIEAEGGTDLASGSDDNPTANLIRQVLGAVSEFEKAALVSKLRGARRRKRRTGARVEGRKPYSSETLDFVRKLRRRRKDGRAWSYQRIADELTRIGIPTKNGKPWNQGTVAHLLKGKTKLPRTE
jgi:DNA invertase Pin-like site-specific DNA recombinase